MFNLVNTWKAASIKDDAKLAALIKTVGSKEKVFSGAAGGNAANYQQSLIFLSTWCTVHLTLIQVRETPWRLCLPRVAACLLGHAQKGCWYGSER